MQFHDIFFQNWMGIGRTIIVGTLAYVILILFLRVSGKRTLAKLNAFDLVVTVALGSTLSAVILEKSIALADGATALALLISLQYLVTFTSVRSQQFADTIRSEPALLVSKGEFCLSTMKRERVTKNEVLSAVRAAGGDDITRVGSLVLESDGSMSVVLNQPESR